MMNNNLLKIKRQNTLILSFYSDENTRESYHNYLLWMIIYPTLIQMVFLVPTVCRSYTHIILATSTMEIFRCNQSHGK